MAAAAAAAATAFWAVQHTELLEGLLVEPLLSLLPGLLGLLDQLGGQRLCVHGCWLVQGL